MTRSALGCHIAMIEFEPIAQPAEWKDYTTRGGRKYWLKLSGETVITKALVRSRTVCRVGKQCSQQNNYRSEMYRK